MSHLRNRWDTRIVFGTVINELSPASTNASTTLALRAAEAERAVVDGLVRQASGGNAEAFGALYDRFQAEILRYLIHRLHDREQAEDLTQQVFLKAWQAIPRYEQRSIPFKAWLYRMAHNQMVDHFRTTGRASRRTVDLEGVDPAEPAEAEALVLAAESRALLDAALARLSEDHRQVLTLRFLMEHSAAEIGQIMGRKEVTIRGMQLRALRALRVEIEQMGGRP
ncbi:MAG: RNA polymerase sigma factor [Chloroflexi bacterium]|nr:MAG: RNA polymerase sigma factor [Chloroflexota bacterium]